MLNFCLWCHEEKRLVPGKFICSACDSKLPLQVQTEQQAKVQTWKEELETLRIQVQNQPELLRRIEEKANQITQLEQNLTQSQETGRVSEQTGVELARQKAELEEQIRNNTQTYQQELGQLRTDIEQLQTELNSELDEKANLEQNLTELQEQKRLQAIDLQSQIAEKAAKSQRILDLGQELSAIKEQLAESQKVKQEIINLKQTFNQQLKELNVLIDPAAEHYTEPIEFRGFRKALNKKLNKLRTERDESVEELKDRNEKFEKVCIRAEEIQQELQGKVDLLQKKITDLEIQLVNLAQQKIKTKSQGKELLAGLAGKLEEKQKEIVSLTESWQKQGEELGEVKQELSQSQEKNQQLSSELEQVKQESTEISQELGQKKEMLKKSRLEVVGLQAQLKKMPKPEPVKPSLSESEPINPWMLGVILVAGVGLYLLLKRRKE